MVYTGAQMAAMTLHTVSEIDCDSIGLDSQVYVKGPPPGGGTSRKGSSNNWAENGSETPNQADSRHVASSFLVGGTHGEVIQNASYMVSGRDGGRVGSTLTRCKHRTRRRQQGRGPR